MNSYEKILDLVSHTNGPVLSIRESRILLAITAAEQAATQSHDDETKVGAVVTTASFGIVTAKANHQPGLSSPEFPTSGPAKYNYMIHAEQAALLTAMRRSVVEPMLFVTHFPCISCIQLAVYAGVTAIFYLHDHTYKTEEAIEICKRHKIMLTKVIK